MHVQKTQLTDTSIKLAIIAEQSVLDNVKQTVLSQLKKDVKLPGFRAGKVPAELIEKNVDQQVLQNEFLDTAMNRLYGEAITQEKVRPVSQPKVSIKKFVPFTTLEFEAEVEIVGAVTLPDYTKITLDKKPIIVTNDDVQEIVKNLQLRMAEKKLVTRASKDTDEIWIDFEGIDAKTKEPIKGADGKDYPLILGSNTFIPGFEAELVGAKAAESREFTLTFPADYGVEALQGRKVTFTATITKVNEVVLPKADDDFAAKAGPFKSFKELESDIRTQITADRDYKNDREYESDLLNKITDQASVAIPGALVDDELTRLEQEERQNITYRGQTWAEHLAEEGVTEEEHRLKNRPGAELRVKAGLVLAEIAEKEKIDLTADELDMRIQLLKGQYIDTQMQSELDKPENRRDLASRMLSEKTIERIVGYSAKAAKTPKVTTKSKK